jgi:hypothetical protein
MNNFYNSPNIVIATKILFSHIKFKFYNDNTSTILQKEAAETARNEVLVPILDSQTNISELFNAFSSLISIPSIMIEIHREVE